jgi:pimeloyl-ACP methyl ester carboxylesterase
VKRHRTLLAILLLVLLYAVAVSASADGVATTRPTISKQFGSARIDFVVDGRKAFLIHPTNPAANGCRPWLWYAPTFIGQLPNDSHAFIAAQLLQNGFSIAGVDVGESYGRPAGRKIFEALYQRLTTEFGLDEKPCLLPQSRGGLMLYNWAVEHPDHVRCIGGIYTVCDITSYPGIEKAAPAYGMSADALQDQLAEHNPVDRLKPLARAGVPILHIHGDNDKVVPLERNSGALVERYKQLGGPAELIVVPGRGHEVIDEFFKSQRLVDFFLERAKASEKH